MASVVAWPGRPRAGAPVLESHHSHFVLTAGRITAFDINQDPAQLRDIIRHKLFH